MAPCCAPLCTKQPFGRLALVPHPAALLFTALLSAALLLTAGLIVSVFFLFLLGSRRTLLPWLISLVWLVAAALILSSHGFNLGCRRPNVDGIDKVYAGTIQRYVTQEPPR
jgi:hypothetical protein